jgi:hypothetical protein
VQQWIDCCANLGAAFLSLHLRTVWWCGRLIGSFQLCRKFLTAYCTTDHVLYCLMVIHVLPTLAYSFAGVLPMPSFVVSYVFCYVLFLVGMSVCRCSWAAYRWLFSPSVLWLAGCPVSSDGSFLLRLFLGSVNNFKSDVLNHLWDLRFLQETKYKLSSSVLWHGEVLYVLNHGLLCYDTVKSCTCSIMVFCVMTRWSPVGAQSWSSVLTTRSPVGV